MRLSSTSSVLALGLVTAALAASPLAAQPWSFSISAAWLDQSTTGSDTSFRTQTNLDEGFLLEALELTYDGGEDDDRELRLTAWGFGGAEPSRRAALSWRPAGNWKVDFEYRRTESFFQLAETELGLRRDDWAITRWRGKITWAGWKPARLSLSLRHVERDGRITQPFRELRDNYLLGIDLDETRQEAALRLETRDLPVQLIFEQSFARLERRNDWFAAAERDLIGDNPGVLTDADNTRREDRDIPASRLLATWGSDRVEVTGALLWSDADLEVDGETSTTFGIDGGRLGQVQFADDLLGSASFDALVGHLGVGIRLAPKWTLRLTGDHHDRAQDATLLGNRILRLTNALGDAAEIPVAIDESTFFDVTDSQIRVEVEHERENWTLWAGFFDAGRDVDYRRGGDNPAFGANRDSEGSLLGIAWHLGRRLKASVEYEHGSFEEFVFRTDPETVDRFTAKLRTELAKGWQLRLRGRFEEADNPPSQSALDRSSEAVGIGLFWAAEDGLRDFGVDFDQIDLTTETGLVFPDGSPGLSAYDLSLTTLGAHGRAEVGKVRIGGSFQWLEDDGATWPLESWNARLRLGFATTETTEIAVFGDFWSYDETLAGGDDFEVDRYGLAFTWRDR